MRKSGNELESFAGMFNPDGWRGFWDRLAKMFDKRFEIFLHKLRETLVNLHDRFHAEAGHEFAPRNAPGMNMHGMIEVEAREAIPNPCARCPRGKKHPCPPGRRCFDRR